MASSSSFIYDGYPNKTVDGDFRQNNYTYCMHTAPEQSEAWLRIDLRKIYNIRSVKLWYRNDIDIPGYNTRRIQGFNIRLSNTSQTVSRHICYQDDGSRGIPPIFEKICEGAAQYVWVYTYRNYGYGAFLEICEMQVYGCSYQDSDGNCIPCDQCKNDCNINGECDEQGCKNDRLTPPYCKECRKGFYGRNCSNACGFCDKQAVCDKMNGSCPSGYCEPGWKHTLDQRCNEECDNRTYGLNCSHNCGRCAEGVSCNKVTGTCPKGCEDGWANIYCNETCRNSFYGRSCSFPCGHCAKNKSCDHMTGSCPFGHCERGWKNASDKRCNEECDNGTFGLHCRSKCSGHCAGGLSCNKVNGSCPEGCEDGWINSYCNEKCDSGTFGLHCRSKCSGHCAGGLSCNKVNGSCPEGCEDGWINSYCNETCRNNFYGKNCSFPCGHCANNATCDHVTGSCPSGLCKRGWKNTSDKRCNEECENGTFGSNCQSKCSGHCAGEIPCNKVDGICTEGCAAGWINLYCNDKCQTNFYGKNCSFSCGHCANNATCDHVTGSCPSGLCKRGWKNNSDKRCDEECENGTFGSNCQLKCSGHCVVGLPCNKVDGLCTEGCAVGWINPYCNDTIKQASECNSNQLVRSSLYGTIAALFLSILLNIFLIVRNAKKAFYMRQSSKKGNKEQDSTIETYVNAPVRNEENTAYQELTVQLNNPSIIDTEESNAGYQELGQLSQPSHYEELKQL